MNHLLNHFDRNDETLELIQRERKRERENNQEFNELLIC